VSDSHDTAEDGFHEIQLSGKQLVFLFIVTTSVIVAVFLCGVLVGRGARAARADERDSAAPSAAPAPSVADVGPPAAEPPMPAAETPDKLSYPDRLQGKGTAPESLKPQDKESRPAAQPHAQPEPPPPVPRPAVQPQPPPTLSAAPSSAPDEVPVAGQPGVWAVQVIATRDRSVATSVVKRLAGKGYPAFLVNPAGGAAQPFYKVHVGRYPDRREAERVSTRIKKEEQFQSWILR
jgi:septal ring-binding cell division protein DamX